MLEGREAHEEVQNSKQDADTANLKKTRGRAKRVLGGQADDNKVRLALPIPQSHPLHNFLIEVKNRDLKDFDLGTLVLDVLEAQPANWWAEMLEQLTPLEYKINAALSDPQMREKLTMLLSSEKLKKGEPPLHS